MKNRFSNIKEEEEKEESGEGEEEEAIDLGVSENYFDAKENPSNSEDLSLLSEMGLSNTQITETVKEHVSGPHNKRESLVSKFFFEINKFEEQDMKVYEVDFSQHSKHTL